MPVSDRDHFNLYCTLRNQILTRFFAYGRYFRTNSLSLANSLGYLRASPVGPEPTVQDDPILPCGENRRASVKPPDSEYRDAADLQARLASDPGLADKELWTVSSHFRENPALFGAQLVTALAMECALGVGRGALPILKVYSEALSSLYKFSENEYAGYPIRWDAATSDTWQIGQVGGVPDRLIRCCEFALDQNGRHLYCTPFDHPEYIPWNPVKLAGTSQEGNDWDPTVGEWTPRRRTVTALRGWEPSMDEVLGLVAIYSLMFSFGDTELQTMVRLQVDRLGSYLATHGYLLVRPCGGFAARGATGVIPVFEFPFGRVFERITGNRHGSTVSFEDAMQTAGDWPSMARTVDEAGILGVAAGILLGLNFAPIGAVLSGLGGNIMGRALGVYLSRDCHDVWHADQRQEFVLAYALKQIEAEQRFQLWIRGPGDIADVISALITAATGAGVDPGALENIRAGFLRIGRFARGFPQFVALTALGDNTDVRVRDAYLFYVRNISIQDQPGELSNTGLARATAVALGDASLTQELRDWLDEAYITITETDFRRSALWDESGIVVEGLRPPRPGGFQKPMGALEYIACLALSWYAVRSGRDQTGVLPKWTEGIQDVPRPTIPQRVFRETSMPSLKNLDAPIGSDYDPFPENAPTADQQKPPEPEPSPPPVNVMERFDVVIGEGDSLVQLPTSLRPGDRVAFEPGGEIWAGVWGTGNNGPGGWDNIDNDPKFPLRGSHPFCLLYRILPLETSPGGAGWRRLAAPIGFVYQSSSNSIGTVEFRTNDDTPGNGSGNFTCRVEIRRAS